MAWTVDTTGNIKVLTRPTRKKDPWAPEPTAGVTDYVRNVSNQLRVDLPASQSQVQGSPSGPANIEAWIKQNQAKLEEAYAASGKTPPWQRATAVPTAVSRATSQAVKIPSLPSGTYNPYTDPRFARMLQQLEQAISSPFAPKVEETPQYQAAQASLQRQAEEQAKRAVQQMAARNILRSSMTEQAYKDIAQGVTEALQTQVAPQVYQQLLGERQQQIQNLMSQLQAALSAAGFGAEEQARAFQQAMDVAQLQENIRQANIMRQLQEAGITGYLGGVPTLERQLQEAGLLGTYQGQPTLAARQLELDRWWKEQQLGLERLARSQRNFTDVVKENLLSRIVRNGYASLNESEKLLAAALLGVKPPEEPPTIEDDKAWIDEQLLRGATHRELEAVIDRKAAEGALQAWEANELKKYLWSRQILSAR